LDSGLYAIVPGKVEESALLSRITASDEAERMPPEGKPLSAAEVETLKRWIAAGAKWEKHWAFVPPQRADLPSASRPDWSQNPIDRFILARLDEEKIAPAPEADRVTLLRRVSLDLTGLPPTPAEVAAFSSDQSAEAYTKVVERLLASPHYGERWARPWLDVARYADSNGYSIDAPRQIWKYRDWVVAALNRDFPYNQFVIEQLAGDLLPNPTVEQKIATGFNRNTQINKEGGIDAEQFRIEAVLDRVNTFGTAFLGLTIACAQCHDHKFDPLSHQDYYSLYAFFNNTVDDGHGENRLGGLLVFGEDGKPDPTLADDVVAARASLRRHLL
jgi:hypothetical protein